METLWQWEAAGYLYVFKGSLGGGLGVVEEFERVVAGPRCQDLLSGVESQAGDLVYVIVQRADDRVVLHVLLGSLIHHHLNEHLEKSDKVQHKRHSHQGSTLITFTMFLRDTVPPPGVMWQS